MESILLVVLFAQGHKGSRETERIREKEEARRQNEGEKAQFTGRKVRVTDLTERFFSSITIHVGAAYNLQVLLYGEQDVTFGTSYMCKCRDNEDTWWAYNWLECGKANGG